MSITGPPCTPIHTIEALLQGGQIDPLLNSALNTCVCCLLFSFVWKLAIKHLSLQNHVEFCCKHRRVRHATGCMVTHLSEEGTFITRIELRTQIFVWGQVWNFSIVVFILQHLHVLCPASSYRLHCTPNGLSDFECDTAFCKPGNWVSAVREQSRLWGRNHTFSELFTLFHTIHHTSSIIILKVAYLQQSAHVLFLPGSQELLWFSSHILLHTHVHAYDII